MALVCKTLMMGLGLGLTIASATAAPARDGKDRPINERRQARMMERFGEEGIDADGDGVLTREELRAFHEEKGCPEGHRGLLAGPGRGRGHHGPRWGPGGRLGRLVQELETLRSQTPPVWFTIERFPDADVNQDGALNAEEWTSFADGRQAGVVEQILNMGPTADADRDGQLSEPELTILKDAHTTRVRAHVLERHPDADSDGDGTLSDAEFDAVKATRLARILERHPRADLDGDGVLSAEEANAFAMDRPGGHAGPHGPRDRGDGRHGKFRHGPDCEASGEKP